MADFEKPSNTEDEYFAREDIEKKRKLALEQAKQTVAAERERLKQLHHMRCPKCGMQLQSVQQGEVEVDTCFNCHGIWLDAGELQKLEDQRRRGGAPVVEAVLNWFKRS
ncbi:MAG: zf-TFIIB domain-containing protein [Myxococcaceae bacterium]